MKAFFIAMLICATVLAGCSTSRILTSTEPQQTVYTLRPVIETGQSATISARVLEISKPLLSPGLDTDRIILFLSNGQKMDYYTAARWSAPLGDVLQDVTRRSASAVLPYVVAVTEDEHLNAPLRLQIKVTEFQPVYEGSANAPATLKVTIEFNLILTSTDKIVRSFALSKEARAADNRLDIITAGLEQMLQEIEYEAFMKLDDVLRQGA